MTWKMGLTAWQVKLLRWLESFRLLPIVLLSLSPLDEELPSSIFRRGIGSVPNNDFLDPKMPVTNALLPDC
jgi:hypothetical protein